MNQYEQQQSEELDLLDELVEGEDEFDVDLLACGCRLAAEPSLNLSMHDILRLYNFDEKDVAALLGALVNEGGVEAKKVFELAERVSKGELSEPDPRSPRVRRPFTRPRREDE